MWENELDKILISIDKIEDDQEFCDAEEQAVYEYCKKRNFNMTADEMATIRSRALEPAFDCWVNNRLLYGGFDCIF